jgi:alanyl-tRNA synthetase
MKTSAQIRQAFLDFFKAKGHAIVPSSSLVPGNDPTLLFTNAGMVQFKDVFLGAEKRSYTRATSSQRCVRAGGKHNDLDSVGYTARHHTFFEMLGNFSFGDYFKRDAICFAWELLTQVYAIPAEKLWVTVYYTDDEAFELWEKVVGVPRERIVRIDDNKGAPYASDNFWQMADTGPCGPCTEIFYDHGSDVAGGPPGSAEQDGDRYIEIWNLVFMQFDRSSDGTLTPLPAPCVDTGMGLERLAAVLQNVHSNYEIDLFQNLIKAAGEFTQVKNLDEKSLFVIADHIRACSFLIVDGVLPSNEGRGYVLRRIIRRALRHGWKLGVRDLFFYRMVTPLVHEMGDAYPELRKKQTLVEAALKAEEERFAETLGQGMRVFEDIVATAKTQIQGADVFRLYDTYGFPFDLTADIARERGLNVDIEGFEKAMDVQRNRARAASHFGAVNQLSVDQIKTLTPTVFTGYDSNENDHCKIIAIVRDGQSMSELIEGQATLILDQTPFYAESGGQVGDKGVLRSSQGEFVVEDTQKISGVFHAHLGFWKGAKLKLGDVVRAQIDVNARQAIKLNHSATHLLHAALQAVLGEHVQQKGSLVASDRLRFDFAHFQPISALELIEIEALVNTQIRQNNAVHSTEMALQEALDIGAMSLFGEKYGERVRVLKMGDFSTELCGGTHAERTGDLGLFKITSESGVASGVRRIEAVTGAAALRVIGEQERKLSEVASMLGGGQHEIVEKLKQVIDKQKKLEQERDKLKLQAAYASLDELLKHSVEVNGIHIVITRIPDVDAKVLRESIDRAKQKLVDAVILLVARAEGNKLSLVAGVAGRASGLVKAGALVEQVTQKIGGKGGGRPDLAQGGGEDSPKLDVALQEAIAWVKQSLNT